MGISSLYSQQNDSIYQYCLISGTQKLFSTKVNVTIDYGQEIKWGSHILKDENGDKLKFNSMVDAINYMATKGWEFQQAYAVTVGEQNIYHYLLRKPFKKEDLIE